MVKKEGVQRMDIIPYVVPANANNEYGEEGELHFERTYYAHRDIGPDGEMFPCLKKTFNMACPICDYRKQLLTDPDADEKLVKSMAPKERQLWNVFDPDDPDKGVQLWEYSFHLFGKQLDARITSSDEEDGYEFFADPDEGMTLKVGFAEESFGQNTFYTASSIDFKARREPISDELLKKAQILDNLLLKYKYDDLKNIFLATTEDKKEDGPIREPADKEDEPDTTVRRRRPEPVQEVPPKKEVESPRRREVKEEKPAVEERQERRTVSNDAAKSVRAAEEKPKTQPDTATTASRSKKPVTAADFGIEINQVVDHDELGECTVVKISGDGTACYVLDKNNKKYSVGPDELKIVEFEDDPEPPPPPPKTGKGGKKAKEAEPATEGDDQEWDENWVEPGK